MTGNRDTALSIVVAARNDSYGERAPERAAAHAGSIDGFADALGPPVEHVIVEWAALPGWAPLAEVLPPVTSPLVTRRIIHAEGAEVNAVNAEKGRTFHEWTAKNVGIRRAASPYVAITNQDILFLPELAGAVRDWLDSELAASTYARCDRLNISVAPDEPIPARMSIEEVLSRRQSLSWRLSTTIPVASRSIRELITMATRPVAGESVGRYNLHLRHGHDPVPETGHHTNASGDLLLAAKSALMAADGHWESTDWRTHLDAMLVYRLWGIGLGQSVLRFPAVAVHVDHQGGDSFWPEWTTVEPHRWPIQAGEPYPGQPDTWGLTGVAFDETRVTAARTGARAPAAASSPGPEMENPPLDLATLDLPADIGDLLELLRVHRADAPKVRLGRSHDGGYVIPANVLRLASRLVSIGISDDSSFEEDWYERTGKPVSMFDGSGPCPGICERFPAGEGSLIRFTQRHVGNLPDQVPLAAALAGPPDALFKMDAEGAEFDTIPAVDLSGCVAILLEAHFLDQEEYRRRLTGILRVIERDFLLVHLHGNNCCPCVPLPVALQGTGCGIPQVIEMTFLHRRFQREPGRLDASAFPTPGLDAPNNATDEDLQLGWVNRY